MNSRWSIDHKIKAWHLWTMMSQRKISYQELANEMGVSRQQADSLIREFKINQFDAIEAAITRITVRRALECVELTPKTVDLCEAVYYVCGEEPKLAKYRAAEERKRWAAPGTPTPTL